MILVNEIAGNIHDHQWKALCQDLSPDSVSLSASDAQKNKFKTTTRDGEEIALSLPRDKRISHGDILHFDASSGKLIVAEVRYPDVMQITLTDTEELSPDEFLALSFRLGHALGNQHWPAVLRGRSVYVPVAIDKKVMLSAMKTHRFSNISLEFKTGEEVSKTMSLGEIRLLFGSSSAHHHTHDNESESVLVNAEHE